MALTVPAAAIPWLIGLGVVGVIVGGVWWLLDNIDTGR